MMQYPEHNCHPRSRRRYASRFKGKVKGDRSSPSSSSAAPSTGGKGKGNFSGQKGERRAFATEVIKEEPTEPDHSPEDPCCRMRASKTWIRGDRR